MSVSGEEREQRLVPAVAEKIHFPREKSCHLGKGVMAETVRSGSMSVSPCIAN